jgi:hypothetical protein
MYQDPLDSHSKTYSFPFSNLTVSLLSQVEIEEKKECRRPVCLNQAICKAAPERQKDGLSFDAVHLKIHRLTLCRFRKGCTVRTVL